MTASHPRPSRQQQEGYIGLLFLLPWILGFLLFKAGPILAALGFSLTDFKMLSPESTRFIGLENYIRLIGDSNAGAGIFGSIGYFITTVPLQLAVALALAAIFTSDRLKNRRFLRTLFFMPSIISATAIFFVMIGLADPRTGWINKLFLEPLGLPPMQSLFSAMGFTILLMVMALWSIGPGFLILLSAMQAIPQEIYEAARVDGAGPVLRFVSITLPMISPAIFFTLVVNLTGVFGGAVLLDRGYLFSQSLSPMESYITSMMFDEGELGYASTLAWAMFVVTMSITIALFRSARKWVYFPEEERHDDL